MLEIISKYFKYSPKKTYLKVFIAGILSDYQCIASEPVTFIFCILLVCAANKEESGQDMSLNAYEVSVFLQPL